MAFRFLVPRSDPLNSTCTFRACRRFATRGEGSSCHSQKTGWSASEKSNSRGIKHSAVGERKAVGDFAFMKIRTWCDCFRFISKQQFPRITHCCTFYKGKNKEFFFFSKKLTAAPLLYGTFCLFQQWQRSVAARYSFITRVTVVFESVKWNLRNGIFLIQAARTHHLWHSPVICRPKKKKRLGKWWAG